MVAIFLLYSRIDFPRFYKKKKSAYETLQWIPITVRNLLLGDQK